MSMKLWILLFALVASPVFAAEERAEELWERAIVTVEVTRKEYEYLQPWGRRVSQAMKMGTILSDKQILTTAEHLSNHTLIRLQKGRGRWYRGELAWVDYHANLALITCKEEPFWEDTKGASLAEVTPRRGTAQLVRWRAGALELRNVELNRMAVKKGKITFVDLPHLEVDSEISGVGWGEAIVQGNKVIGITSSKEEHSITVIPSFFIRECLEDKKKDTYQGLGYFPFVWQSTENPETLEYLGLKGEPRGVVVILVDTNRHDSPLQPRDIILEVEGFKIDVQGDYRDPDYGDLLLENLASRGKRAGDGVKMKIFRDGKEKELTYTLPKVDYKAELVPMMVPDQEPEYLLMGGLLFQPLTVSYLQTWGANDWSRKAPFRLVYATRESPRPDRPSYVILSMVLPDPFNLGYQESRYLLLDKFNGEKIANLRDLVSAVGKPKDGFHLVEFIEGDSLRRMILDAKELDEATARVLERYGIQTDRYITEPPSNGVRLTKD